MSTMEVLLWVAGMSVFFIVITPAMWSSYGGIRELLSKKWTDKADK
jgi:hypothetical protein